MHFLTTSRSEEDSMRNSPLEAFQKWFAKLVIFPESPMNFQYRK